MKVIESLKFDFVNAQGSIKKEMLNYYMILLYFVYIQLDC